MAKSGLLRLAGLVLIVVLAAAAYLLYDAWGSPVTRPHMSVAWSWAFDTPFKWTKQVASHFGGTRQGMVISWPNRIKDAGGIRHQFHHVIDGHARIVQDDLENTYDACFEQGAEKACSYKP